MRPILTLRGGAKPATEKGRPCPATPSELVCDIAERHGLNSTEANALQRFANDANAAVRSWRGKPRLVVGNALQRDVDQWCYLHNRPNPLRGSAQ